MDKNNTKKLLDSNSLYEASRKPTQSGIKRTLEAVWLVGGISFLIWLAWAEPFSKHLFGWLLAVGVPATLINYVCAPLVMVLRAVLAVESIGYAYHRFFQHLGWLTRRAQVFRRNQRFHWIHHMIIYPIGRLYRRGDKYHPSEKGVGLSWVLPGLMVAALFISTKGLNFASVVFVAAMYVYAKWVVDLAHARFHLDTHPWMHSPYFHWLEDIHILHHWDQRKNFTIVHPAMDFLFGTYLSPRKHRAELEVGSQEQELTVSDFINWRYLLTEATPAEYAAFISEARRHKRGVQKLNLIVSVLNDRLAMHPDDAEASELKRLSLDLFAEIGKEPSAK